MKLGEYERQTMSNATVVVLLDARAMALRNGANPLKLWDQLLARMRAAARTTTSAAEWSTKFLRDLQIEAPSRDLSRSMEALATATQGRAREWLALVEREHGYIIALARLEAERRKDAAGFARADDLGATLREGIDEWTKRTPAEEAK